MHQINLDKTQMLTDMGVCELFDGGDSGFDLPKVLRGFTTITPIYPRFYIFARI